MKENKYIKVGVSNWVITFADNVSYEIKYLQEENVTHFVNTYNIILKNAVFEKDILEKFKREIPIEELEQISEMNGLKGDKQKFNFYYTNPVLYKIQMNGINDSFSSFDMYFRELGSKLDLKGEN